MTVYGIGLGMVAPTILAHATEPVRRRYLPQMYRGDIVGCQLFSEPGAGSDLASVQAQATRDGDEWIVTGQKVWTSGAHLSDIGEIVCRTDPDLPKHKGLTAFVVDMHAAGVETRPLRQMTGGASFNEVFFTEVRIPDSHRLGDVNGGWSVALTTLMNERAAIGGGSDLRKRPDGHGTADRARAPRRAQQRPARAPAARRHLHSGACGQLHEPEGDGEDRGRGASRARDVDSQAVAHREHAQDERRSCRRCSGRSSSPTTANGAPTPGRATCSAYPGCGSPAAPTRSCATSCPSGFSECRRTRARPVRR